MSISLQTLRGVLVALLVCGLAAGVAVGAGTQQVASPLATQPPPSIFGINTGTFDSSHARFVRDLPTARRLGARWVHFTGASIHFTRAASPNFGALDYEVSHARSLGLGVLVSLGGTPAACSISPRPADPSSCPPTTPSDLRAYARFLRAELLRYGRQVTYWESWLEPNHKSFWPSGPNPAQYARLLSAQWSVFQSVNRGHGLHLKLLFAGPADFSIIPGSPGGVAVLPFTDAVLSDLHGSRPFDAIGLHPYRFPPATTGPTVADYDSVAGIPKASGANGPYPAQGCDTSPWCRMTWPEELSAYEQEFANHGYRAVPLWLTEFGWPGNRRRGDDYHPDFTEQANDLAQAYQDLLALPFVQAAFWFNLRDYQPGLANPDPKFFAHYGLLQNTFAPKPAAGEFRRLAAAHPNR